MRDGWNATHEVAGDDVVTTNEVLQQIGAVTGQSPIRIPVPSSVALVGAGLAKAAGIDIPINEAKIAMLIEGNVTQPGANALTSVFGVHATPFANALKQLATDRLPENLPSEGVGRLERKRFWADISGSRLSATELLDLFRRDCRTIMPIEFDAEPGADNVVAVGRTLTASLPVRGHIQMRVQEVEEQRITFATLEGHPLAGVVQFLTEQTGAMIRFTVQFYARASTAFDFVAMKTVGRFAQNANWLAVVEEMVNHSGGVAPSGVESETTLLDDESADAAENWIADLIAARQREESVAAATGR